MLVIVLFCIRIEFLQRMDYFDCFVENNYEIKRLPNELLDIIKSYNIEHLKEQVKKKIKQQSQDRLRKELMEDIQSYGSDYLYASTLRSTLRAPIPKCENIIKSLLNHTYWPMMGELPPQIHVLRFARADNPTPEWMFILKKKRYLKYKTDFVHCLSQLKCSAGYFKRGNLSISKTLELTLQFGYNLGRLQEISGKPEYNIFWQPAQRLFQEQDWNGLDLYIDKWKNHFQISDYQTILDNTK